MPQNEEDKGSMWDFNYQKNRAIAGKKLNAQGTNCCEMLMVGIFKHLIHIFMFVFIIALGSMLYIVSGPETDNMGIGEDSASQINLID